MKLLAEDLINCPVSAYVVHHNAHVSFVSLIDILRLSLYIHQYEMTGLAASSCEARNTKGTMPACRIFAGILAAMVMKAGYVG